MNCQEFNDIIFECIEGNLSFRKRKGVNAHLKHCTKCQTVLSSQMDILEKLYSLPKLDCPDSVIENVFNTVNMSEGRGSFIIKIYEFLPERLSWKLSFAAAVAVIILMIFVFYPKNEMTEHHQLTYSEKEIEQAKNDVELALAYVNHYAKKTESVIEQQVISKPFIKPLKSTMQIAFKPLLNGGKL